MVECGTVGGRDDGSRPPPAIYKHGQLCSLHCCLSFGRDTKSPFCLVSMSGEVKDPTWGKCVTYCGHLNYLKKHNL